MEFPDYTIKENINEKLKYIIQEIDYFKNKKDLIRFIIRLDNMLNKERDIFMETLISIARSIENSEISDDNLKKINNIIYGFLMRNDKEYYNKIQNKDYIIYEYSNDYSVYIKNPIDLKEFLDNKFKNNQIASIIIDGVKWKNIENIKKEDMIGAKLIKIVILK